MRSIFTVKNPGGRLRALARPGWWATAFDGSASSPASGWCPANASHSGSAGYRCGTPSTFRGGALNARGASGHGAAKERHAQICEHRAPDRPFLAHAELRSLGRRGDDSIALGRVDAVIPLLVEYFDDVR
jgi:hypothetical protein